MILDVISSSFSQGVVWAVMAIGVYITFRLLDIADLSAEGVFPLGGAIAAILITNGLNPFFATAAAFAGGAAGGLLAGWIHTKLHIPPLLTGILLQTGLYSVNFQVMGGRSNLALLGQETIFTPMEDMFGFSKNMSVTVLGLIILAIIITLLVLFLHTEMGLSLRATGDNPRMSEANGINTNRMKTLGYIIGNGLIALSGAMVAQKDGFADLSMGIGTIVIGLASVIIAEVVIPNQSIGFRLTSIILGSFIYRLIIDFILNQPWIDIRPTDLRLFSAILLGFVLYFPQIQRQFGSRKKSAVSGGAK
ncbi:ABC transporter permease [Ruoffia tabacinasalis]|uniref:ABC transporter permease n=1 Tax=Ruoffia tabacinasalis TaxID=87458 RepID=UPI0030CEED03